MHRTVITIRRTIRAALAATKPLRYTALSGEIAALAAHIASTSKESTMAQPTRPEFLTLPTDVLVKQRSICLRPELGEDPRMREVLVDLADRASDELDARAAAA
ncbi:hypothetical protein [Streptomyces lydicamycinicus]|uniref:hypothetical protein n=1 Tax=Streptomyces lydicamycinicus TaxID=1546107 RepID=UPI003C2E9130